MLSWLLLPVVIVALWRPVFRKWLTPKGIPDIPAYDDPVPFWGDMGRFKKAIDESGGFSKCFDDAARNLGVMAQIRLGFFKTFIVLADYPTIEHVLLKQHGTIDRAKQTTELFKGLIPTGQIALPTNDQWKHHRRIVGPAMTSKYLALATPLANQAISDLIDYWKVKADAAGGRSFTAETDLEGATMDAICAMAFGASWGVSNTYKKQVTKPSTAPPLYRSMIYLFSSVSNTSITPRLSHFLTSLRPTYRRHRAGLDAYLKAKTQAARDWASEVGADVAVDTATSTLDMMVARELRGEDWMTEEEMRDELYLYLIAGTETSSTTLSWWTKYMTNHPEIQHKLRREILDKYPELQDRPPTFDDLDVPYLEAVVHETLRLSRTAGAYVRETMTDVVILGKRVPAGTTIVIPTVTGMEDLESPVFSMPEVQSQDPRLLDKALSSQREPTATRRVGFWAANTGHLFQPERWIKDGKFDINAGPSLPFSLGQRACFGKNLALLELRLFICQLCLAFFFDAVPENQNSFGRRESITNHPLQSLIRPVPWPDASASVS